MRAESVPRAAARSTMTPSRGRARCSRGLRSESGPRALARSTMTPSGFANSVRRALGRREATASQTTSLLHDPSYPRFPHCHGGRNSRIRQCNSDVKSQESFSLYRCNRCTIKGIVGQGPSRCTRKPAGRMVEPFSAGTTNFLAPTVCREAVDNCTSWYTVSSSPGAPRSPKRSPQALS